MAAVAGVLPMRSTVVGRSAFVVRLDFPVMLSCFRIVKIFWLYRFRE